MRGDRNLPILREEVKKEAVGYERVWKGKETALPQTPQELLEACRHVVNLRIVLLSCRQAEGPFLSMVESMAEKIQGDWGENECGNHKLAAL